MKSTFEFGGNKMTTLLSYLLTFIAILFWIFRVLTTLFYELDIDFFAEPLNEYLEIIVLFASLPCLLLVIKRNIIGAAAYFGIYGAYFGTVLYNQVVGAQSNGLTVANASDIVFLGFLPRFPCCMDCTPFSFTSFLICFTRRSEIPKLCATCFIVHLPFIHASIKVTLFNSLGFNIKYSTLLVFT